ncbi:class I SAM-dependent methyltransferase [bacterium]|nr:class I SAM-dependent methyltransferase [bacterium]
MIKAVVHKEHKLRNKLYAMYSRYGWWERFYFNVKYRKGSAFEVVEKYVPYQGYIIDLGCGTGIFSNLLAMKSDKRQILGVDMDERRAELATSISGNKKNLKFISADIRHTKFDRCDIIIMYDLIHHVTKQMQEDIISRCYDILDKDGLLIIKDIDKKPLWKYLSVYAIDAFSSITNITRGSKLTFRESVEFSNLLERRGFKTEVIHLKIRDFAPHVLYLCRK